MKKLLTTLLLSLSLLVTFAQKAAYARATTLTIGVKNWTGTFEWADPQVTEGITVKIEPTVITIDSQTPQHYTIYSTSKEVEVNGSAVYWYAYDLDGQRCRLYIIENEVGDDFLAIEYNDFAWIYGLVPLK